MNAVRERFHSPFFILQLILTGLGLTQVYSSSFIYAHETMGSGYYFFQKQVLFAVVGLSLSLFVSFISLQFLKKWGWVFFIVSIVGLILTFVPGLSIKAGGAARWIQLPFGFRLEPSEFLKLGFCLWLSSLFLLEETKFILKWPLWLRAGISVLPFFLLLKQPDFGSFALLICIFSFVLFGMGLRWKWIAIAASVILPLFYFLVMQVGYRRERILAFLDPWMDPQGRGYQIIQSMMTFSRGGVWGEGFGQGQGKLFFLPEAHTDFTLAVFGEEVGWMGVLVLLFIYGSVTYLGIRLALLCEDKFCRVLSLALTTLFTFSTFINMGVVMGLLPTKGLTLPFLSYGGSSLLTMSLCFGIFMLIEKEQENLRN